MKIKEVIIEGFWKNVGNMAKGVGQGVFKGAADFVAPGAVDDIKKSFKQANNLKPSKAGNIKYKGNEYQWLGQQWGLVNPATGKTVPAPKSVQQQLNFMATRRKPDFSKMSDDELSNAAKLAAKSGGTYGQKELGAEIAKRQANPTQQAAQNNQQQPQANAAPGVTLVSQEPIILKYQGKDYGLNDRGEWVSQKTGKMPPQSTSAFLDQQAGALTGTSFNQPTQIKKTNQNIPTDATKIATVTTPRGIKADKWSDGQWTTPDEQGSDGFVVDADVPHLEALLQQQQQATK